MDEYCNSLTAADVNLHRVSNGIGKDVIQSISSAFQKIKNNILVASREHCGCDGSQYDFDLSRTKESTRNETRRLVEEALSVIKSRFTISDEAPDAFCRVLDAIELLAAAPLKAKGKDSTTRRIVTTSDNEAAVAGIGVGAGAFLAGATVACPPLALAGWFFTAGSMAVAATQPTEYVTYETTYEWNDDVGDLRSASDIVKKGFNTVFHLISSYIKTMPVLADLNREIKNLERSSDFSRMTFDSFRDRGSSIVTKMAKAQLFTVVSIKCIERGAARGISHRADMTEVRTSAAKTISDIVSCTCGFVSDPDLLAEEANKVTERIKAIATGGRFLTGAVAMLEAMRDAVISSASALFGTFLDNLPSGLIANWINPTIKGILDSFKDALRSTLNSLINKASLLK